MCMKIADIRLFSLVTAILSRIQEKQVLDGDVRWKGKFSIPLDPQIQTRTVPD